MNSRKTYHRGYEFINLSLLDLINYNLSYLDSVIEIFYANPNICLYKINN